MKLFNSYLASFDFPREYWRTLIIDSLTLIILLTLIFSFSNLINQKAYDISGGKSIEQLKLTLISGDADFNQEFTGKLRAFAYYFVGGLILLFILTFIIFSYSRQLIWENGKKIRWNWNGLNLILLIFFIIYVLIFALIRSIFNSLTFQTQNMGIIASRSLNAFFLVIFTIFTLLVYFTFSKNKKVWVTIGETFSLIKNKFLIILKTSVLIILTGIFVSILSYYIQSYLKYSSQWTQLIISLGILLLYLSWTRLFLKRNLN